MNYTWDHSTPDTKEPVDYVNPNIGTLSYKTWSTSPTVQLPHGMVEVDPHTTPGIGDKYLADKIFGFSFGASSIMASTGDLNIEPKANASDFDHDLETVSPYFYGVLLEAYDIEVMYTVTEHCAYYRFLYPSADNSQLLVYMPGSVQWFYRPGIAQVEIIGDHILEGYHLSRNVKTFFHAEFSQPFAVYGTWKNKEVIPNSRVQSGEEIGVFITYHTPCGERVEVKVGISYISTDQAYKNLAHEIPDWDFERVKNRARETWNRVLGRIRVEGGTEDQKTIFYTAIHRALQRMKDITEYGQYFNGFDGQVHPSGDHDFYTADQPWDTYRCAHPLQAIIEPERINDILQSYVRMYEQYGFIPNTPNIGGDHASMVGRHITAIITDAYLKGFRNFDVEKAYEGIKKNALERTMLPWRNGPITELDRFYSEKGYFPALPVREDMKVEDPDRWRENVAAIIGSRLPYQITWLPEVSVEEWVQAVDPWHRRQSVSTTLETAYDDWCLAQIAKVLGKGEDFDYFIKRAGNYRNLFNPKIGFMAPKTAEGEWVEPFDPKLSGGFAGEAYFAEMNSWTYTFHVQHDVQGLINIMGGREAFIRKLNALFVEQYTMDKPAFWGQFPDMSGMIGQYAHGNEPSFHIPYLYNYAGAPWRTQRRVRDIMSIWYNAGPMGLCGDDDIGALSSWYVFSAMGFYPVCPGRPVYDIGSPIFNRVTIDLGVKTFEIRAEDTSTRNKYIQSAALNSKPIDRPWFYHDELVNGGILEFSMGPRPNKAWGSAPASAPPSMSR